MKKLAPVYVTSLGVWGDMFVCYANISLITNRIGRKVSVLHYGTDPDVAKFLEHQDNVEEVFFASPESEEEYQNVIIESRDGTDWAKRIFADQVDSLVIPTHLDGEMITNLMIARHFEYKLPDRTHKNFDKDALLLNPFSFQSCLPKSHWPWIPEAVEYLVDEKKQKVILVGLEKTRYSATNEYFDFPLQTDHPRIMNFVGKTKSMLEVLSLAEQCKGIVTTSNALSMWSIISNKPALVWAHKKLTNPVVPGHEYYKEWIQAEPNTIIWWEQTLDDFKKECDEWLHALAAKKD